MKIETLVSQPSTKVLIVDDDEFNRLCLAAPLERLDYIIEEAVDGQEALDKVKASPPDLVLLDIMLPKVDGIEVCRRLKSDSATNMIPIIMVTVLDDQGHRIRAIEAGANDFLNKPVDLHEVVLRVNNAVKSKKTYDALQESFRKVKEIRHAQQDLTNMIVHDIRSPLTVAIGHMDLLLHEAKDRLTQEDRESVHHAMEGLRQIDNMSETMLGVQRMENGDVHVNHEKLEMVSLCRKVLDSFKQLFSDRTLELTSSDNSIFYSGDEELIQRVIANLLVNAKKFTSRGGLICLELRKTAQYMSITCVDNGQGIPKEFVPKVFERYAQGETMEKNRGVGLGLSFCKMAVEAHGGHVGVESQEGKGAKFILSFPFT